MSTFANVPRTRKIHVVDVDAAITLWLQHRNWSKVAELLPAAANGHKWSKMGIYMAVRLTGRLPQHARESGSKRDLAETNLGHIWHPPLPKPLRVIPDYRTGTVREA